MTRTSAPFTDWASALRHLEAATPERPVVLADTRWYWDRSGVDAYRDGHAPSAVHVDLDEHLSGDRTPTSGRQPLPTPEQFAAAMTRVGISTACRVYAYDDAGGVIAARLVWMLRTQNVEAAVISGGLAAYPGTLTQPDNAQEQGLGDADTPHQVTGSTEAERMGDAAPPFRARPWPTDRVVATTDIARDILADPDHRRYLLIDARPADRFHGQEPAVDPRLGVVPQADPLSGHIPGAVSLPCRANLTADGHIRPQEELAERFISAGLPTSPAEMNHVIAYCGSGVTACHNLLAIEHAGLGHARLYPGSWSAWSRTPGLPVARE